jgi:hypothetical protein
MIDYLKLPAWGINEEIRKKAQGYYDHWKENPFKCLCDCGGIKAPKEMSYVIF